MESCKIQQTPEGWKPFQTDKLLNYFPLLLDNSVAQVKRMNFFYIFLNGNTLLNRTMKTLWKCDVTVNGKILDGKCVPITNPTYYHWYPFILTLHHCHRKILQIFILLKFFLMLQKRELVWQLCVIAVIWCWFCLILSGPR